jgi:hypoxanthine-DNA glycosylase
VTPKRPAQHNTPDAAAGILHGFPPVESECARVLVLGSMPGAASLRARQYYAHPQNAFWRIAGDLFGFDPAAPYAVRTAALAASGVALWDVLMNCARPGSMDSDIEPDTIVCNDFASFFGRHPLVTRVFFNGATAERLFLRRVRPKLVRGPELRCERLPSTSPAYASVPYAEKLRAWRAIVPEADECRTPERISNVKPTISFEEGENGR